MRTTQGARQVLALSLLAAALGAQPLPALAAPAAHYQIQAGSLTQALNRFAAEAGITVQFSPDLTEGRASSGLRGEYSAEEGLATLLAGSGLQAVSQGDGVYVVVRSEAGSGSDGALELSALSVNAQGTTTEGSGLYGASTAKTALPFNMSLRDTPQSISVISEQMIEDKKIKNLADVIENSTGLSINRYESNRSSIFSRGFNINNYLIDGSPTTINEQWSAGELFSNTVVYDHVEILRGSDGLMTGVGNPSAVINLVRKRADSKTLTGSVAVDAGSWSQRGTTVDVGSPLTPSGTTRARVVANYDEGDHYMDLRKNRQHILYATLEQDIGDSTLLSAGINHQENHTGSPTWGGMPAWIASSPYDATRADWGRSKTTSAAWSYWNTQYTNWFINAEQGLGDDWRLKLGYSRGDRQSESKLIDNYFYPINPQDGHSYLYFDFGGFIYALPTSGYGGMYFVDNDKENVDVQLEGKFELLGLSHELAFGYDHETERFEADGAPANIDADQVPSIFDWNGHVVEPSYIPRQNYQHNKITQEALYAAGRFSLAEPLKLILGARMVDYRVVDFNDSGNDFKLDNEVIPYAGLVLDITSNISAYASYASIFEPQKQRSASNKLLSPIEGNTREYGLKGAFFDNRLNASLSIFRIQQDNVAKANGFIDNVSPLQTAYVEVKGVESRGFEIEVVGEVMPDWNVSTGYSRFKAKDGNGDDVNSLIPRKQFNLFTSYRLPGALHGLTVGGGVRWQSETYAQQALTPKLEQDAYWLVDLMARYQLDKQWSAQLNVNNVLDKKYYGLTEDAMQVYRQQPRSTELTVKYEF
ncbi:TonB-dependent siderophore receptor [Pseudomonas sp. LRF_L74]|uniref:TonB-dependent siderophore receptor n=1 Tax=Pseudomonas sp. LRF_L74 TaxID=3369422 RepID=UPI003F60DE14